MTFDPVSVRDQFPSLRRDAVFFDGKKSLDVKQDRVAIDFHPAGVKVKGPHRTVIVPLANCLWIQVAE